MNHPFPRRISLTSSLFALVLLAIATGPLIMAPSSAHATVRVVATTAPLAAVVKEVVGEHGTVRSLGTHTEDPHYVDARPNFILHLSRADVLYANGLEYEVGWLPQLQVNARNADVTAGGDGFVEVSEYVQLLGVPSGPIDRSMGDIHPGGNPHFMMDPRAAADVAEGVASHLARRDPTNAEAYRRNAARFAQQMRDFAEEQRERFAALSEEERRIVTYHESLIYLSDWLDLEEVATVEPRPGIPPSPGHVSRVLSTMRATSTRVLVQEMFYPRSTSRRLAELADGELVVVPGGPDLRSGESYHSFVESLANDIHEALTR